MHEKINRDCHQLVEMCSLVDTLLIDHEAIYDARHGNDRLLLGLKGSLSEYELDLLRQRSLEARWQKARRGELVLVRPVGFVNSADGQVEKDPDLRVQSAVKLMFDKFFELGSARQVLTWFIDTGLQVPTRRYESGSWATCWKRPAYRMIVRVLADPTYAGAYVFGRTVQTSQVHDGVLKKKSVRRPTAEIPVLLRDHHEGYVSWELFEKVQQMLANNTRGFDATRQGAAKKGVALLAGLLRCRRCGRKLMVFYSGRQYTVPRYNYNRGRLDSGESRSKRKIPRFTSEGRDAAGWMNLTEAARYIQVGPMTLRRAVERGVVHADHPLPAGSWIFSRSVTIFVDPFKAARRTRYATLRAA